MPYWSALKVMSRKSIVTCKAFIIFTGSNNGTSPSMTVASNRPLNPSMPKGMRTISKTFA